MEFNKENCKILLEKISVLLKPLEEEFGVQIRRGRSTYSMNDLQVKFNILKTSEKGTVVKLEDDFNKYAKLYGLKQTDLGREFNSNGKIFKICGLSPSKRKYPVLAKELSNNKIYKFNENTVKMLLGD